MSNISAWSSTAASNNAAAPDGWPEGQTAGSVNNCGREVMAAVRTWYEQAEFTDLGHTPTRVSGSAFSVSTDLTATYTDRRRIQVYNSGAIIYGDIISSSYTNPDTTVTCRFDSGSITASVSAVAVGILNPTTGYTTDIIANPARQAQGYVPGGGAADLYSATASPAWSGSYGAGDFIRMGIAATNATTTPTVEVSSLSAQTIVLADGSTTPAIGDLQSGYVAMLLHDGTNQRLLNPFYSYRGLVHRVYASTAAAATYSTATPLDDTIPQNDEGASILTAVFKARQPDANRVRIRFECPVWGLSSTNTVVWAMFKGSESDAFAVTAKTVAGANSYERIDFVHEMAATSLSASTTIMVRAGMDAGTLTVNGVSSARQFGGVSITSLIIDELAV